MIDYDDFVAFMKSWKDYEFTTNVNPFFVIDGEHQIAGMEIL